MVYVRPLKFIKSLDRSRHSKEYNMNRSPQKIGYFKENLSFVLAIKHTLITDNFLKYPQNI